MPTTIAPIMLQRRLVEVGRIRLGMKKESKNGKSYPAKLEQFRLTSRDQQRLEAAAQIYGGTVKAWGDQWELFTEATALDIAVVPGQVLSQSFELWGQKTQRGGRKSAVICLRRCDGITEALSGSGCLCADEDAQQCKPTTRLSVVLTEVPGLGVWRLESHGWNAAAELAGSVQLLEALVATGRPVRARLRLDQREQKTETETRQFVVPVLDIDHTLGQVMESLGVGTPTAVGAGEQRAVGSGFTPVPVAALPEGPGASSIADAVTTVGQEARAPRANGAEPIKATGVRPRPAAAAGDPVEVSEVPPSSDGGSGGPVEGDGSQVSGSPPAAEDPEVAKSRAQQVAIKCREAGLDDDGRHHFLAAFSKGWYSSAKDVPPDQLAELFGALVRYKRGELEPVEQHDGTWRLIDKTRPPVGASPAADAGSQPSLAESGPWGRDRWREQFAAVPGIGEAKLMRYARERADAIGVEAPLSLDELTDETLVAECLAWLSEKAAA